MHSVGSPLFAKQRVIGAIIHRFFRVSDAFNLNGSRRILKKHFFCFEAAVQESSPS
jgi:hypothetical protein